jgi:hypothetical protein
MRLDHFDTLIYKLLIRVLPFNAFWAYICTPASTCPVWNYTIRTVRIAPGILVLIQYLEILYRYRFSVKKDVSYLLVGRIRKYCWHYLKLCGNERASQLKVRRVSTSIWQQWVRWSGAESFLTIVRAQHLAQNLLPRTQWEREMNECGFHDFWRSDRYR